ncbi:MAG TPA: TRAP transporter small permease [Firmicutes bacterium]|nr:TRAP transporter small permease [Bacillota bacterium]
MERLIRAGKTVQRLTFYACAASMFVLLPMMLLTASDVLSRTMFSHPIPGAVELSEYMLVVVILLGLAYTQQVKGHPRVTLITARFSVPFQAVLEIFVSLLGMFMIVIVIWQGWALSMGRAASVVSEVLRISQFPFRLLVSVGSLLLFFELLVDLLLATEKLLGSRNG